MPSIDEILEDGGFQTPLAAALAAGVDNISYSQEVSFSLYRRVILPADGYVFWVKSSAQEGSAIFNVMGFNTNTFNDPGSSATSGSTLNVKGSLHYVSDSRQEQEASYTKNRVVFTSLSEIQAFNDIGPDEIFIGSFDGIRFAFSSRGSLYRQANLFHYVGDAVYNVMQSQIIDDPRLLNTQQTIVSNSLPAWLAFGRYNPIYPVPVPRPRVPLWPSFLVQDNASPPFVAVHIVPGATQSLQGAPAFGSDFSQGNLASDQVLLTLYGFNNDMAQDFLAAILQWTLDEEIVGLMGTIPTIRDEKQGQNELDILAMKKTINFTVSYNQQRLREVARQMITDCVTEFYIGDEPLPPL